MGSDGTMDGATGAAPATMPVNSMKRVALACAWRPRKELSRWLRLRSTLEQAYAGITVAVPPDADVDEARELEAQLGVTVAIAPKRFWARPTSLRTALETAGDAITHIHYADGDRLVHWIETHQQEWLETLSALQRTDCLIIGRTERAFQTHPQAMQQTEGIINAVTSHLLGMAVDLGGGSRGLSRPAVEAVLTRTVPEHFGDAEWPFTLQRLGFRVDYRAVEGLDWETPDHYQERVADAEDQQRVAEAYDQRVDRWAARVRTAAEIVDEALAATRQPLSTP